MGADRLNCVIHGCSADLRLRWSAGDRILPSYHDEPAAYAQVLLDIVRAHRVRVVIPSMDGSVAALRPWRSSFKRQDVALALASEAAFDVANDKRRTLEVANELGIPYPLTVPIELHRGHPSGPRGGRIPCRHQTNRSWVSNRDLATRVISEAVVEESEALAHVARLHELGSSWSPSSW